MSTSVYGEEQPLNRAEMKTELSLGKSICKCCVEEMREKRQMK